ncbi:MAG: 4-hydroxy-tetrahydrodipicolinate synthase [Mailhella sp.]|nr:4-hydroxy-tetrahydrodipicolinate synthase [Mailhella sp.]
MIRGAITALALPFKNGEIDEESYRRHIEWQIEQGIHGLVPCGTTGESATLSHEEHERAIKICIDQVKGRVPVIAGSGSNNTTEAIRLTKFAKQAGADAALLITPYYNKPTQEGIFRHFETIAKEVSLPMVVYNVPGRTGSNVLPATMVRMYREIPEVIGVKEATGNLIQISNILENVDDKFILLSGDDFTVLPSLSLGAKGVISVTANIMPHSMAAMVDAWDAGNVAEARRLHFLMEPVNRAMFLESNPIPVKYSLHRMGRFSDEIRLPMTVLAEKFRPQLEEVLTNAGLI